MERISSRSTFLHKKVIPVFFVGFVLPWVATDLGFPRSSGFAVLAIPGFMLVVCGVVFRIFVWPLADEVRDTGDYLVVRRGPAEERVALSDILKVSVSYFTNPQRVTLELARASIEFGNEVVFVPRTGFRLTPFSRIKLADQLIERVHRARSRQAD